MDIYSQQFRDQLAATISKSESGGNYAAVNKDTGALGKYQFMPTTLQSLGYNVSNQDFLNNPELQEQAFDKFVEGNKNALLKKGYIKGNNDYANAAGLLMAAHLGGLGGAYKVATNSGTAADANGTTIQEYYRRGFSSFNSTNSELNEISLANQYGTSRATIQEIQALPGSMPPESFGDIFHAARESAYVNTESGLDTLRQDTLSQINDANVTAGGKPIELLPTLEPVQSRYGTAQQMGWASPLSQEQQFNQQVQAQLQANPDLKLPYSNYEQYLKLTHESFMNKQNEQALTVQASPGFSEQAANFAGSAVGWLQDPQNAAFTALSMFGGEALVAQKIGRIGASVAMNVATAVPGELQAYSTKQELKLPTSAGEVIENLALAGILGGAFEGASIGIKALVRAGKSGIMRALVKKSDANQVLDGLKEFAAKTDQMPIKDVEIMQNLNKLNPEADMPTFSAKISAAAKALDMGNVVDVGRVMAKDMDGIQIKPAQVVDTTPTLGYNIGKDLDVANANVSYIATMLNDIKTNIDTPSTQPWLDELSTMAKTMDAPIESPKLANELTSLQQAINDSVDLEVPNIKEDTKIQLPDTDDAGQPSIRETTLAQLENDIAEERTLVQELKGCLGL